MHRSAVQIIPAIAAVVLPAVIMAAAAITTMAVLPVIPAAAPAGAAIALAPCAALRVLFPTAATGGAVIPAFLTIPVPAVPVIPAGSAVAGNGPGRGRPCRR